MINLVRMHPIEVQYQNVLYAQRDVCVKAQYCLLVTLILSISLRANSWIIRDNVTNMNSDIIATNTKPEQNATERFLHKRFR